jgi:D-amino peptidase
VKIYLITDMEGVSGVSGFDVRESSRPQDVELRRVWSALWIGEVNAAVAGAVAAGANHVLVLDNHGPGDTLAAEALASPAQLLHGGRRDSWLTRLDASYDAVVIIGQHAMAGASGGHLHHTYSRRRLERVSLHGPEKHGPEKIQTEIGEIGLIVGIAGEFDIPVVFLSGDEAATVEIEALVPGVETAAVKKGLSRECCISLAAADSCDRIRTGVERALRQRHQVQPQSIEPPIELRLRYASRCGWRAAARWLRGGPGLSWRPIRDLRVRGDSMRQTWDRAIGLTG